MPLTHIPCAPGGHIGEQIARSYLVEQLATSRGVLLTNYHHRAGNGTEEHDLLLINERGVWALEVKHWFGRIDADQVYWQHNGNRHPSPINVIEGKAKSIASAIREAGFTNVSVVGAVVLTRTDTRFGSEPPDQHQRKLFRLTRRLIDAVSGTDYRYRPSNQDLTPHDIQRITEVLVQRKVDPERRIVGNYRLVRELDPGVGHRCHEAIHVRINTRRARIKQYTVTGYTSRPELDDAARRFEQDVRAIEQLDGHPAIVRAYDFFGDPDSDDTFWLALEWIEGQTLASRLDHVEPISYDEQLQIMRALALALDVCHTQGIIHRNVNPDSIMLVDDGSIKLGDFDFARVPSIGRTISRTGVPLTISKYVAQELRDGFRAADARSDIYSLGAVWYTMALRRPDDEPILTAKIVEAQLPPDAQDLLRMLLAPQPHRRLQTAAEMSDYLAVL